MFFIQDLCQLCMYSGVNRDDCVRFLSLRHNKGNVLPCTVAYINPSIVKTPKRLALLNLLMVYLAIQ
jgi:hypothetical protein